MTTLPPSPFESVASAMEAAASSPLISMSEAAADPFNDEPLPLFLTDPAPELDRDLEAMLRVIFGVAA